MAWPFQRTNLFPTLTVAENLRLAAGAGRPGSAALFASMARKAPGVEAAHGIARRVAFES